MNESSNELYFEAGAHGAATPHPEAKEQKQMKRVATALLFRAQHVLYTIAGIILATTAVSHFLLSISGSVILNAPNLVFPMCSDRLIHLVAAMIEFSLAVGCFKSRESTLPGIFLLWYVTILGIYKYALGGVACRCLGKMGMVFGFLPETESKISFILMCLLVLAGVPSTLLRVRNACISAAGGSKAGVVPVGLLVFLCVSHANAQLIELKGGFLYKEYCREKKRFEITTETVFQVRVDGPGYDVCVTNRNNPQDWIRVFSDGTNCYAFAPFVGHFLDDPEKTNLYGPGLAHCSINPGRIYISGLYDWLEADIPWAVFVLSPKHDKCDKDNSLVIPLPWRLPRYELHGYGYRWKLEPFPDQRFFRSCTIVRDPSLDLKSVWDELLREELVYPESLEDLRRRFEDIEIRKADPAGFVIREFTCWDWIFTNGVHIPTHVTVRTFALPARLRISTNVVGIGEIEVDSITLSETGRLGQLAPPNSFVIVHDYRFKKTANQRAFPFADYILAPGQNWKEADDPELLAQQATWLRTGPKMTQFRKEPVPVYVWLLLAGTTLAMFGVWLHEQHSKNRNKEKEGLV